MKTKENTMFRKLALLIGLVCLPALSIAQVATTGFDHLKIPSGGRFAGMGEATTALVDDIEALNINVGGLSRLQNLQFFVEGQFWVQDVKFGGFSVAVPLKFFSSKSLPGVVGASVQLFGITPFDIYDTWGGTASGQASFSAMRIKLGYSLQLLKISSMILNAGISAAIVTRNVDNNTADPGKLKPAVDVGVLATFFHNSASLRNIMGDSFNVGVVVNNVDFINAGQNDNAPTSVRLGLGAMLFKTLNLGIDVLQTKGRAFGKGTQANIGLEYWLKNLVAFRVGAKLGADQSSFFSGGVGFQYKIGQNMAHLDYAIIPMGDFGLTHKVSIKFDIAKVEIKVPDKTDVYYYKGVDFFLHSQYAEAIDMWEKVLKKNPGHKEAKKRIDEARRIMKLEDQQKDLKKLEDGYKKLQQQGQSGGNTTKDAPDDQPQDQNPPK